MKTLKKLLIVPLIFGLMTLVGCGLSVTNTLQLVIAAAEAAVSVASPAEAVVVNPYLLAVSQATSFAASELASTDSTANKVEKIVNQFATIAAPQLPAGTPQKIVAVIKAVDTAVVNFLASIQVPSPTPSRLANAHAAAVKVAAVTPKSIKVSAADLKKLAAIKARAEALAAKLK